MFSIVFLLSLHSVICRLQTIFRAILNLYSYNITFLFMNCLRCSLLSLGTLVFWMLDVDVANFCYNWLKTLLWDDRYIKPEKRLSANKNVACFVTQTNKPKHLGVKAQAGRSGLYAPAFTTKLENKICIIKSIASLQRKKVRSEQYRHDAVDV